MRRRRWPWVVLALALLPLALLAYGLWLAQTMPVVHEFHYRAADWPQGAAPMRIVLATDIHVRDLHGSRDRVARIVDQINALKPDLILLGGDYVGGEVQTHPESEVPQALAPLAGLKAKFGVVAVLGNHDHWSDGNLIRNTLRGQHIRVLTNSATSVGPLVIGGMDDQYTHHARLLPTEQAMLARTGARILLAHSPDVFGLERLPIGLTLVGHTHCGQVALPFYGAIFVATSLGRRFSCGLYSEPGRTLIVSGGVGYSNIPVRTFASPDIWLIEAGPA